MSATRCESCNKPRTTDPKCPRCGGEWDVKRDLTARAVWDLAIDTATDLKVNGVGVIKRGDRVVQSVDGKEIRDDFAAAAMSGLLQRDYSISYAEIVRQAYAIADEMMRVRDETGKSEENQ